ncbi:MAG: glycosyltransferase [Bacilli bacterium]|jgi:1,2-diacylglycerol 3-alpha-glucosyltransferase|nr:glycosyltransferase [Bacilli bacterium]
MRIALFSDTYPPQINGVATATWTLAHVLMAKGHKVMVVTPALEGQKKISYIDGIVRIPGITVKRLYNYKFSSFYNRRVYRLIKDFAPEVIHIQTEAGIGIFGRIVSFNLGIPLVYTYHTMYEDYTYYVTKGFKPFDRFAKRVVASFSAMIGDSTTEFMTTSYKTRDALRRYGVKKYINVVPNGLDLSAFQADHISSSRLDELKEKYGLKDKFVILILGRLAKEKSNGIILSFLSSYLKNKRKSGIKLLIVGDGPDKAALEKKVSDLKMNSYTEFVGPVPHSDVPLFYALADLYVSASTSETQGLTYNEAMASKTLVLARYDDNLSGIIEDEVTGFFFTNERSFDEKLEKIMSLGEEEKEKIIESAYRRDMELFGLELYYKRIMEVYAKACRKYW